VTDRRPISDLGSGQQVLLHKKNQEGREQNCDGQNVAYLYFRRRRLIGRQKYICALVNFIKPISFILLFSCSIIQATV